MPGVVYFLEGPGSIGARGVRDLGLGYVLEGDSLARVQASRGPGGAGGVIFSTTTTSLAEAGAVAWKVYPGKTSLWIGLLPGELPPPSAFARRRSLSGHEVELGDGRRWLVPVARAVDGSTPLPRRLKFGLEGWTPGEVLEVHRELFGQACRVWDALVGADTESVTFEDELSLACMALAANYRLGPVEVSLLGLLTTETEVEVLKALVDFPALEELKKKVDSGQLTLGSGLEDSSPVTPPASPSSS